MTFLLSSSVIAALVGAFFALYTAQKKQVSDHITSERKAWRDQLRDTATALGTTKNIYQLRAVLPAFKTRINANGIHWIGKKRTDLPQEIFEEINDDGHLWRLIATAETVTVSGSDFTALKRALIDYTSILLKDDWERSKREVIGEKSNIVFNVILVIMTALYILLAVNLFLVTNFVTPPTQEPTTETEQQDQVVDNTDFATPPTQDSATETALKEQDEPSGKEDINQKGQTYVNFILAVPLVLIAFGFLIIILFLTKYLIKQLYKSFYKSKWNWLIPVLLIIFPLLAIWLPVYSKQENLPELIFALHALINSFILVPFMFYYNMYLSQEFLAFNDQKNRMKENIHQIEQSMPLSVNHGYTKTITHFTATLADNEALSIEVSTPPKDN